MAVITSAQWQAMLDAADEGQKPFFQKLYDDAVQREREATASARAAHIADQVALLRIPEANADRFQEELAAAVAALVRLRTLENVESRMTTLEQRNEELLAKVISLEQSQLSASRPPNPRSAVVPVSQSNTTLIVRSSGTMASAGTGASSSSGSVDSSALVPVPNAGTLAQNATVLTGVHYRGPMVDKRAATLPSKYDGKADITSWISSMQSYFEVMRIPQEDRSMIIGTNIEPAVRNHIELQAVAAGYERIDLTEWMKATPVRTLEDLLLDRYQDKHAALKARLKLEALKGQTCRSSMQALEQYLTGLFTTPDLGMTDVSCMDVVMGVTPKEYLSHATWREFMKDLVNLGAKDLAKRKKAPAAGGKPQRKGFGSSNQLALHDYREAEDQSYADDLSLDDDLEPDSNTGWMKGSAQKFIVECQVCQRIKVHRHKPYGLLRPLPIPDGPGESISIDFMDMGKVSEAGNSQVMVIVDRFSKFLNLIPLPPHAPTELVIEEFHQQYILQSGVPKTIVSDRDTRFINKDWKDFTSQIYDIKLNKTSGRHPEANGLAEEINQPVIQLLCALILPDQNTWDKELHKVKGLYNNSIHSATGVTPNQLQYGWPMRNPLSYLFPERSPGLMPDMPGYNAKYARLLKAVTAAMNKRQLAMIKHANKLRKEEKFKVADYVWVKMSEFSDEEGISRKLLPLYYDPW
ncbi:hypothetical protein CBR_g41769 [Chara braunii]|uniref:Integrase catalytic domain-containing protein n=1 Tax=Chara braunii TaxID=69332 RepID=A0A388LWQ7_CHABU|nr:hypothetical protein CBR_g41769 [Chara braunii]|eukprot:GBG86705.1 hypothetical protein CBR_g41769 [Chara braunii]